MANTRRSEIVAVSVDGLQLSVDGGSESVAWSTVTGVSAGQGKLDRQSDRWILILSIEIALRGETRLFLIGEIEAIWGPLIGILDTALPGIPPFETWRADLLAAMAPLELYERHDPPR